MQPLQAFILTHSVFVFSLMALALTALGEVAIRDAIRDEEAPRFLGLAADEDPDGDD